MIILLLSVAGIYLILHIYLFSGYIRSSKVSKLSSIPEIKVSVVVAARNEECNISNCIKSLKKINYPPNLLEIILVDDQSTDATKFLMVKETAELKSFSVIESPINTSGNLKGKPNAIDSGIRNSTGEIIFITDADCEVPENWVNETLKYYDNESVGMVCGFTNIKESRNIFTKPQSLDWIYLLSLATSSNGINKALACIGNNISFRKNVYDKIGGYQEISFSVTEDLALLRAISSNNYIVKFPINPECLVKTHPCANLSELYHQKKRWIKGGTGINFLGYIMGIELYLINFVFLFGLFFLKPEVYLLIIIIKLLSEILITLPVYYKLKFKKLFIYYPLFQIYFALYGLIFPLSFLINNKINWKGRKY